MIANKILIDVYLPAALRSFDVLIPAEMRLVQTATLIANALSQMSGYLYASDNTPMLCDRSTGEILNINMSASELGLCNGSQLMLI